jgi:hypothetical protein
VALSINGIIEQILVHRQAGAKGFKGMSFPQMAQGVGAGVFAWAINNPSNLGLIGVVSGAMGPGTVPAPTTRLVVPANTSIVLAALRGVGLNGQLWTSLGTTMALGVSHALTLYGQYLGISPSVAIGVDSSTITTANGGSLISSLRGTLQGYLGSGVLISSLATGLGLGLSGMILGSSGVGTVTGSPVPPGFVTTGTTISVVV